MGLDMCIDLWAEMRTDMCVRTYVECGPTAEQTSKGGQVYRPSV